MSHERASDPALVELLECDPGRALRAVAGRITFPWQRGPERWIVKRTRGDLGRDRWFDRLHGAAGRSPGRREFDNLRALAADGIPVPAAIGWAESGGRSLVAMACVAHEANLRELVEADPGAARRWLGPLVGLVAALHARGWYHRDLYLQHFVPSPEGAGLVLLDVGRARRQRRPRRRWHEKDLAALLHSTPEGVGPRARLRFLVAYLAARGLPRRGTARAWARRVERRRARLARHVPREAR